MVRINLINPKSLSDQHLIAEYNEILMLLGYVKKYPKPDSIPKKYALGQGHIKFFKNKLLYLKNRHELIKKEMRNRGFFPVKQINLRHYPKRFQNNWFPKEPDIKIIKKRLIEKIKLKPDYYKYYRKKELSDFLIKKIKNSKL